jgi:hypothetical protein
MAESRFVHLEKGQVFSESSRHEARIVSVRGVLWVTREGDRRDYVLEPGQSVAVGRRRKAVVSALTVADVRVDPAG